MGMEKLIEDIENEAIEQTIREIQGLKEHRCSCGRLLGKFSGRAEVKCPKCGKVNEIG